MFTDLSVKQKSLQKMREPNPGSIALKTDALTTLANDTNEQKV